MDLKFDEMTVKTTLAKDYVQKLEFSKLYANYEELTSYVFDGSTYLKRLGIQNSRDTEKQRKNITEKLNDLASSISRNEELIAGLEYMYRNIPVEDTKTQLNIITKHLTSYAPVLESEEIVGSYETSIQILSDDPLLIFGNIKRLLFSKYITFVATRSSAYVAHFFTELSYDCGLDVYLEFTNEENLPLRTNIGWDSGTVAVVSEDADVDSAVDKLITSSKLAPWRLKRILVQESVYQQFKDALTWKCNLKGKKDETVSKILCSATLTYDDRTFIIDPVDLVNEYAGVSVEAYRTTKEMLSMIQQGKTHYLSLWSNGIAEINEVAHRSGSPIVWINNLAEFRGPSQITHAIYTDRFDELKIQNCANTSALLKTLKDWQNTKFEVRKRILCSLHPVIESLVPSEVADNIRESLLECQMKSFVDVGDNYVCVGKSSPVGIILVSRDNIFTPRTFKLLLYGNAILTLSGHLESKEIRKPYCTRNVPIESITEVNKVTDGNGTSVHVSLDSTFKAIWTNSGTIFAN
ncbi:unnamed protein product [Chrysodeixis includens]|uniref:Uncharacterized protein n=1 Tax=Chrysodeixis includens TaxID=689277 RepID=A0A9N8L5T8_CHRIL|nr:unnamed protein product [Chrysodeixis includens]